MGGARQHRLPGSRKFRENQKLTVNEVKIAANEFLRIRNFPDLQRLLNLTPDGIFKILYPAYTLFEINRKQKKRSILKPDKELLWFQRHLAFYLKCAYVDIILKGELNVSSAYAYIPALKDVHENWNPKNIVTNASIHTNKKLVATLDIENFFNSITKSQVLSLFTGKLFQIPEDVADFLANAVTFNGALPVGAPTSPILSNLILMDLDNEFVKFSNITYSRYSDDIVLSTNFYSEEEFATILTSAIDIIESYGFSINKSKKTIRKSTQRQVVTGITVNEKANVPRKYVRNIRAILHSIQIKGWNEAAENYIEKNQRSFLKSASNYYLSRFNYVVANEIILNSINTKLWYFNFSLRSKIEHIGYVKGRGDGVYIDLLKSFKTLKYDHNQVILAPTLDFIDDNVFVTNATANSIVFYAYAFLKNSGFDDDEIKELRSKFSLMGKADISFKELLLGFQNQSAYFLNLYFYMSNNQRFEKFINDLANNESFNSVFKNYNNPISLLRFYNRRIYHTTKDCESLHNDYSDGSKFYPNTGVFSDRNGKPMPRYYILRREFLDKLSMRKCENC